MDALRNGLFEAGQAAIGLFATPYFYIALLLVWWHASQGVKLQRKLFHVRLYGTLYLLLIRVAAGALAGAALSAASLGAGAKLSPETLLCVWAAMAALSLFRLRYVCLAYAAGALGLLQAVLGWTVPEGNDAGEVWLHVLHAVNGIDVPGLLFLAGLLHVAEGLLVRMQGAKTAIPLFLEGKRGKPIGAFALSGAWPIPLIWLVPAGGTNGFQLPWMPIFGDAAVWTFLAFPVVIGFSDRTVSFWPERKARTSGNDLMLYGIVLAALAAGAAYWKPLAVVASIAAFALHEALVWLSRFREAGRNPAYAQDGTGVRILAVLPGTPAAEMGLLAGETIRKVNGAATRTKEDLHAALQRQSAFCRMEVLNREGHVKFLQRARYAGEHHQLGLVLAPDESADFVAAPRSASIWQGLRDAGARRRRGAAIARSEAEAAGLEQAAGNGDAGTGSGAGSGEAGGATGGDSAVGPEAHAAAEAAAPPTDPGLPPRRTKR
ncbi:PDZ domain-containing protein [Cohnella sp. CFH 77786]|uniref:PDZ domain-containing protein n=1 Tax=Cohnella sp. CFH 77786 TaxID=2662265 RepID=UPI001C60DA62|nr:PDZ domain-containing protein [Cohnella sp. CFH 77786]MBW5448434.1 PDZ domain-containing protein [Cohnella sp. CFH 77786]